VFYGVEEDFVLLAFATPPGQTGHMKTLYAKDKLPGSNRKP
jgi:hypothetical protein